MMKMPHMFWFPLKFFSHSHSYRKIYIFDAYGAKYRWQEVINMIAKCAATLYSANPPCTYMKINQQNISPGALKESEMHLG